MKTTTAREQTPATAASPAPADARRSVPSVERVMQALGPLTLPRPLVVRAVRQTLDHLRADRGRASVLPTPLINGAGDTDALPLDPLSFDAVVAEARAAIERVGRKRLQPVINGTGIILHTNFGRAPLSDAAIAALQDIGANYSSLEYDLDAAERGGRAAYLEQALAVLCEAEAATVVNNCAAALVLTVRHFTAERPEVILSRGELVQIGGGFRVPEILAAAGATLREVGTTNQTAAEDYARAVGPGTGLILRVHRSNFFMDGFVASPAPEALAALASEHGIPFVEDLGSGAVFATEAIAGVEHEVTVAEVLRRGADLVTFSGDKLLGGPQAGIIAGKAAAVAALKREPLFRALRCDKLVFAALQATVDAFLAGQAESTLPVQKMARGTEAELRRRADGLVAQLAGLPVQVAVISVRSEIGGGSLPRSELASVGIELAPMRVTTEALAQRLGRATPPVIGRIVRDRLRLDLRTVFPRQDALLAATLRRALTDA